MEAENREHSTPSHSEPGTDTEIDVPPKGPSPAASGSPGPQTEVPRQRRAPRRTAVRDREATRPGVDSAIFDETDTTNKQLANENRGARQMANQQTGRVGKQQRQSEGKEPLRLRLDVNLDLDIELRARIHGDVTLALL